MLKEFEVQSIESETHPEIDPATVAETVIGPLKEIMDSGNEQRLADLLPKLSRENLGFALRSDQSRGQVLGILDKYFGYAFPKDGMYGHESYVPLMEMTREIVLEDIQNNGGLATGHYQEMPNILSMVAHNVEGGQKTAFVKAME